MTTELYWHVNAGEITGIDGLDPITLHVRFHVYGDTFEVSLLDVEHPEDFNEYLLTAVNWKHLLQRWAYDPDNHDEVWDRIIDAEDERERVHR